MTITDTVTALVNDLDSRASDLQTTQKYLEGTQPLAYLAKSARDATKLGRLGANLAKVQVDSIAERLRITALTREGTPDTELWADYKANDLDQQLPEAFRSALGLGRSYAIAWDKTGTRRPRVTVESALNVNLDVDPGTGLTTSGIKRWSKGGKTFAVLYLPDRIVRFEAPAADAIDGFREVKSIDNPLGVVPIVEFRNGGLLSTPRSEIEDLKPLIDALNKILADMMVGSEFYARPRRWASGIEMETDDEGNPVNPFPEGDRMMLAEDAAARFGSLPAADLAAYEAAVKIVISQIMAVSSLPAHYLGQLMGQTPGADGLRAAEAALTARSESKQSYFGRSVESLGRLMHAIRTGTDPEAVMIAARWADPATRSVAQEADAVVKLHQAGLLPADYALARLGYGDDEIREIKAARRAEALDKLVAQAGAAQAATA